MTGKRQQRLVHQHWDYCRTGLVALVASQLTDGGR